MRLTFLGAAGMVTGSCYLLEAGGLRLLIDCGLFQGREEELNRQPFPFHPATLDGVILTHAHIDHSGRLPLLRRQGFKGPIYTHSATVELAAIMLADAAHIQEADAERENRKGRRAGRHPVEPLYTQADAQEVASQFKAISYDEPTSLNEWVTFTMRDVGHILGSAFVELVETDRDGVAVKILFSGDIGQPGLPILQDPHFAEEADYLVMESTYGARLHDRRETTIDALAEIIQSTVAKGGNLIIPSFAVGRAQELLYEFNALAEAKRLPEGLTVVLDSPLAIAATEVVARHAELYDEEAANLVRQGDQPFAFPGLRFTRTADESKELNLAKTPLVIIAGSGMCEGGRVLHHLKYNLWRPESTLLFAGFQAEGTLGRRIQDGAARVRILGEEVAVRARISSLPGLSAHADQGQLLDWVGHLGRPPRQTFLVHGEAEGRTTLQQLLWARGHNVSLPVMHQSVTLEPKVMPASQRRRAKPKPQPQSATAQADALGLSAKRMSALIRELQAMRKAWYAVGPHLAPGQAAEVAQRAEELLKGVQDLQHLIKAGGPTN